MAETSWKNAGTGASVDRDGKVGWIAPENITAADDSTTVCPIEANTYSDWLRATNYGFTSADIPAGSTIDGIAINGRGYIDVVYINDSAVYLRKTSGQIGDNKASAVVWPNTGWSIRSWGGAADTWNAGLTQADIVGNPDFGVDISENNIDPTDSRYAGFDYIQIKIYYTAPTGHTIGGVSVTAVGGVAFTAVGGVTV